MLECLFDQFYFKTKVVSALLLFLVITKPKAKSGNYQRERPMLHMLKLKSPENAR